MNARRLVFAALAGVGLGGLLAASCGCPEPLGFGQEWICDGVVCPDRGPNDHVVPDLGDPSLEHWFAAVIALGDASLELEIEATTELRALGRDVGLDVVGDEDAAELAEAVVAALDTDAAAWLDGPPSYRRAPGTCEVSASAASQALGACFGANEDDDDETDGLVPLSHRCDGLCRVESNEIAIACVDVEAALCESSDLDCDGTCLGACHLEGAQACDGICHGQCDGECDRLRPDGSCDGVCNGTCEGVCDDPTGSSCDGLCEGTCRSPAWPEGCAAPGEIWCELKDDTCATTCRGQIEVDGAPCGSAVQAHVALATRCQAPRLVGGYTLLPAVAQDDELEPVARAAMATRRLRLERLGALVAGEQSEGSTLLAALDRAAGPDRARVEAWIHGLLSGDLTLLASVELACALNELDAVTGLLEARHEAIDDLRGAYDQIATSLGVVDP